MNITVRPDEYEICETFRSLDSKYVDGKLMADGPNRRWEIHGKELPVPEPKLAGMAAAQDNDEINAWNNMVHVIGHGDVNACKNLLKTKEQRRAELDALLCDVC